MMTNQTRRMPFNVVINVMIVYVCYAVCGILFILVNHEIFDFLQLPIRGLIHGSIIFATAAIGYTNILYLVLATFPLHQKQCRIYSDVIKSIYWITNMICVVAMLSDAVFFHYTRHHATAIIFSEFKAENNLSTIVITESISYWYLWIAAIAMGYLLWRGYRRIEIFEDNSYGSKNNYYVRHMCSFLVMTTLAIVGIRGCKVTTASRPISMNDAIVYIPNATNANMVLNAPFCLIRTMTETTRIPRFFNDITIMEQHCQPLHLPCDSLMANKKNIVILIVESLGQEFVGSLNTSLDHGLYKGYTPFVDSLLQVSLSYEQSFANSGFSIDAMPAVLASIPRMDRPFVVSPYSLNHLNGLPSLLSHWNYESAFFHGAENNSLGFQAFAKSIGFNHYFGRTEYDLDNRFGGENDFDGTWAIWDEEYLQHFCLTMNDLKEPFITTVFTATSHHPFALPDRYRDVFVDEGLFPLHKCIRYTDYSLRRFFESAKEQPWYKNTIFVLTADHASSCITHSEYKTEVGAFRIPILFYDPSGEMPRGHMPGIIQQIDIMPTLLSWIGYNRPYIAFGKDILSTNTKDTWAMNWDHLPQFFMGDYVLQHDGEKAIALYDYKQDPLLLHNMLEANEELVLALKTKLEAFMQTYFERMQADNVSVIQNSDE